MVGSGTSRVVRGGHRGSATEPVIRPPALRAVTTGGVDMKYRPKPIDTSNVELPGSIAPLIEKLAKHNHDVWANQRLAQGWKYGPERNDQRMEHPCLVPYQQLPEVEKEIDRQTVVKTLKAILALGYRIEK